MYLVQWGQKIESSGCPANMLITKEERWQVGRLAPGIFLESMKKRLRRSLNSCMGKNITFLKYLTHLHFSFLCHNLKKKFVLLFSMVLVSVFTLADKNVSCR